MYGRFRDDALTFRLGYWEPPPQAKAWGMIRTLSIVDAPTFRLGSCLFLGSAPTLNLTRPSIRR